MDAERFTLVSGGKPSRKCGIMSSGNHLFFSEDGLRMLVTNDMDLSNARCTIQINTYFNSLPVCIADTVEMLARLCRFVQFFLRLGCGKAAPDPRSQPVLLQFSVDGGLTWGLLQEFLFSNNSNQARLVALEIPLRSRTPSTRLRWWQPSENGHFYSPWVIDQVHYQMICHPLTGLYSPQLHILLSQIFIVFLRWLWGAVPVAGDHWKTISPQLMAAHGSSTRAGPGCPFVALMDLRLRS